MSDTYTDKSLVLGGLVMVLVAVLGGLVMVLVVALDLGIGPSPFPCGVWNESSSSSSDSATHQIY